MRLANYSATSVRLKVMSELCEACFFFFVCVCLCFYVPLKRKTNITNTATAATSTTVALGPFLRLKFSRNCFKLLKICLIMTKVITSASIIGSLEWNGSKKHGGLTRFRFTARDNERQFLSGELRGVVELCLVLTEVVEAQRD